MSDESNSSSPPSISLPGYTVRRKIGRGGMSVIYEAVHNGLRTRHAVKVFEAPATNAEAPALAAKFLAEARILATLRHPHVMRVTDCGTLAGGRPFFVMDLHEHGTLADRLAALKPPAPETVRSWYAELRGALALCHRHGIVHGDIKPENVLVDGNGHLILSDFGIARLTDGSFRAALDLATVTLPANFGTPYTLAPECRHGEKANAASDIYSFGVLIFKCLTGLWFEGSPRLLNEIGAAFPEWTGLLGKMLARNPADRFANAGDLPETAPLPQPRPHPAPRAAETSEPSHPIRAWFVGSLATVLVLLLINYTWKFLYMYSLRDAHPDWLSHVFP